MVPLFVRNIMRNGRRTLVSLLVIGIGTAALFLVNAYVQATYMGLKYMAVAQYGHLQIATPDHWTKGSEGALISEAQLVKVNAILRSLPEVKAFTRVLSFSGLVGTENGSTIMVARGIEPGEGPARISADEGHDLEPGDYDRIILGRDLARNLGVTTRDWLSVMGTTVQGAYNAGSLQVAGTFTTGQPEADQRFAVVPLEFAQSLLGTRGSELVIVELKDLEATEAVKERLQREFKAAGLPLEVRTWSQLATFYHQVRGLYGAIFAFMGCTIFGVVFFSIMEVMTLAFLERMREIGTVLAIGTRRVQLFWMLVLEATTVGVLGGLAGTGLGWLLGLLLNRAGLTYTPPSMGSPVPLSVQLSLAAGVVPLVTVVLSTTVSSLYPAVKAARIRIVEALRYV